MKAKQEKTKRLELDRRLLSAVGNGYLYRLPFDKSYFYDTIEVAVMSEGSLEKNVRILFLDTDAITQTANLYMRIESLVAKARTSPDDRRKMLQRLGFVPTYKSFQEFARRMKSQPDLANSAKKIDSYQVHLIIRLAWMMMPSWAKCVREYNAFWGPVANEIPFDYAERS